MVTGWDDPHDNNSAPSGIVGVNYTPSDAFGLASNLIFGPEQRHNSGRDESNLEQRGDDQTDGSIDDLA